MKKSNKSLEEICKEIADLKKQFEAQQTCSEIRRKWIPKYEVQSYLGFKNSQMIKLIKQHHLVTTSIGKKKYIQTNSLLNTMDKIRQPIEL